jgi:hypothetical protein
MPKKKKQDELHKVQDLYAFRSVLSQDVEEYANTMAADGWELVEVYKDANRYRLFFKLPKLESTVSE